MVFAPMFLTAQNVLDGAYPRENMTLRKAMPYQEIRESDAMYSKKVMRYLDLSEKRNHPLYFPTTDIVFPISEGLQPERGRISLYSLIKSAVFADATKYPAFNYRKESLDMTMWWALTKDTTGFGYLPCDETKYDSLTGLYVQVVNPRCIPIQNKDIKAFYIWEEWVFDKQRSVMDVRIIAMAPVMIVPGTTAGLFWIYYPHFRQVFQTHEVVSTNEAVRLSFDDIFAKRLFSSFIVAEANPYDNRMIEEYLMGIEAIREGERIQGVLADYEHDQWEY